MERHSRKRKRGYHGATHSNANAMHPPQATERSKDTATVQTSATAIESSNSLPQDKLPVAQEKPPVAHNKLPVAQEKLPAVHGKMATASGAPRRSCKSETSSPTKFKNKAMAHRSPSPARFYREREQSELQNLNDRLSSHAANVKELQSENARLKLQLEGLDVIKLETQALKTLHKADIDSLHELLDTARQEVIHLEQVLGGVRQDRDRLQGALTAKEEELSSAERVLDGLRQVSELHEQKKGELNVARASLEEQEADLKRLKDELIKEKVANKRLEEDTQKNRHRYIKELEEASSRMNKHLESTDQKLEADYEEMVRCALSSVREKHVRDLASLKNELTSVFQTKIVEWKTKSDRANADLLATRKELKASKAEQDNLRDMSTRLKMDTAASKVQVEEEQTKYQDLRKESEKERCQLQREMTLLKQELSEVRDELEEMGGTNMQLEQQITTYRVILEDLEHKSAFSKQAAWSDQEAGGERSLSPSTGRSPVSAVNRKTYRAGQDVPDTTYLRVNELTHGIHVEEIDSDGRYIALINKADHLVDMCLWTIKQSNTKNKHVQFEIPCSVPLAANQCLLIWSHGNGPFGDKPDCDAILSLPYYRESTTPEELTPDPDTLHGDDALHMVMRGRHWLQRQSSMNIRLEDGDAQLQTKCDFTAVQNNTSLHLASPEKSAIGLTKLRTLAKFFPFNDGVRRVSKAPEEETNRPARETERRPYMQSSKRKRDAEHMRKADVTDKDLMDKDGCVAM